MLTEIEENVESRKETDRIMWFSMWVLLSVASFGIAWFPMVYFLIKRRNDHFGRQEKLETLILSRLRQLSKEKPRHQDSESLSAKTENPEFFRKAQAWALSTLLIFPVFYVFYFLLMDLQKHEEQQHVFLKETNSLAQDSGLSINLGGFATTKKFALDRYLILTIVSCGFAAVYWLYRIFNDYNQHFKEQWKLEDDLLRFFKSSNNSETR